MKILLWHGYLLGGTGSNVYTRMLAREWRSAGHDVTVFCQDAAADVRPAVKLLPVFVKDHYDGYDVKLVQECTQGELDAWVETNARALRDHLPADLVFCNHVLMGGAVGAAVGHACGARFAVKAHGSELEYSMRNNPRLAAWGHEVLQEASAVFVGSAHIRTVLRDICGDVARVHEVPPGVDIDEWRPQAKDAALAHLIEECRRDPPNPPHGSNEPNERLPDDDNAARLGRFLAGDRRTVVYFGKLMRNKGVHLLIEAMRGMDARLVVVGFGDARRELEAMAAGGGGDTLFTGALEHRHLKHLLAFADVSVVPSIFPEAFGMVAAEAAAAGCPPLVARHSGLAEVARGLESEHATAPWSFHSNDVADLRAQLSRVLESNGALRAPARRAAVKLWSWAGVARKLLELAC